MDEVLFNLDAGVGHIIINRPDQRNALNPIVLAGLRGVLGTAALDPKVRVITLTGAGDRVFCAGADLKASLESGGEAFGRGEFRNLLMDIRKCGKVVVALARGHAIGGGMGLLLACDIALACEDTYFSTPEIRVGMFPMMVFALLRRHVGQKRAAEMLFTGEHLTAAEAREAGLVNRIFPRNSFDQEASRYLGRLAGNSLAIVELGKAAVRSETEAGLREELENLEEALEQVMRSEDSREGIRAFIEKRKPIWQDR